LIYPKAGGDTDSVYVPLTGDPYPDSVFVGTNT